MARGNLARDRGREGLLVEELLARRLRQRRDGARCGAVWSERERDRYLRRFLERVERDVLELSADRRRLLFTGCVGELADALGQLADERRRRHGPAPVLLEVVVDAERRIQALEQRLDEERAVSGCAERLGAGSRREVDRGHARLSFERVRQADSSAECLEAHRCLRAHAAGVDEVELALRHRRPRHALADGTDVEREVEDVRQLREVLEQDDSAVVRRHLDAVAAGIEDRDVVGVRPAIREPVGDGLLRVVARPGQSRRRELGQLGDVLGLELGRGEEQPHRAERRARVVVGLVEPAGEAERGCRGGLRLTHPERLAPAGAGGSVLCEELVLADADDERVCAGLAGLLRGRAAADPGLQIPASGYGSAVGREASWSTCLRIAVSQIA